MNCVLRQLNEGSLTRLHLDDENVDDSLIEQVVEQLRANKPLKALCLNLGNEQQTAIEHVLTAVTGHPSLERLEIIGTGIGDTGGSRVALLLQMNQTLAELDLKRTNITDAGVQQLATALVRSPLPALRTLKLVANDLGDAGVRKLAFALTRNCLLSVLRLGCNEIGDAGALDIALALRLNRNLLELGLEGNKLSDKSAIQMAAALEYNSTLLVLDLGHNRIQEDGASAFAKALGVNRSMRVLDLSGNDIQKRGQEKLVVAHLARAVVRQPPDFYGSLGDAGRTDASAGHRPQSPSRHGRGRRTVYLRKSCTLPSHGSSSLLSPQMRIPRSAGHALNVSAPARYREIAVDASSPTRVQLHRISARLSSLGGTRAQSAQPRLRSSHSEPLIRIDVSH